MTKNKPKEKKILKFEIVKRNWGEQMSSPITSTPISFYPESVADEELANKINEIIGRLNETNTTK